MIISIAKRIGKKVPLRSIGGLTSICQCRCLYSGEELGIKNYEKSRKVVEHAVANHAFFKQQFGKQLSNPEYSLTHLEYGLKNLIHLMKNSSDVNLLMTALYHLIQKRADTQEDGYRFDSVIMRAFYYLDMPDEALKFFEDPYVGLLFKQVTSYQILLDLLFEHGKYDDVLQIYEKLISSNRLYSNKYIDVIILATYYQRNTIEDFEKAYALWQNLIKNSKQVQFRKSRTFVAALAVKQNQPKLALEILKGETMYVSMRHIKLMAWAQTGQFDEIFSMLRSVIELNNKTKMDPKTSNQVITSIEKAVRLKASQDEQEEFKKLKDILLANNLTMDKTFDDIMLAPFPVLPQAKIYHKRT